MTNRQNIKQAIAALEAQGNILSQTVVETTLAALRQQLNDLNKQEISSSAMQGERKHVTIMFADISGFTAMSEKLDPEEVRSLINACFERIGATIDRYAGHIDKFIGDAIMALFGAPVAHENDPERALRAALDMMETLEVFNREHADQISKPLALHFGINSGLVIAGGIGTRQRQDYSVMGDTVNLAARLEGLSEAGEILVGEDTYRLTAPLFEFEALKPIKVKGKTRPVRVYRLLKAKAVAGGQIRGIEGLYSPLVGRVEELTLLNQSLSQVCQGQGGVISVTGDTGLGKSRLIEELCISCMQDGRAYWAEGRALSYGDSASYLVARQVLGQLMAIDFEGSPIEAALVLRKELKMLLPEQSTDVYPYLAHFLDIHLDNEALQRIKYLDGDALQQRIIQAVQTYIIARSQQNPLILIWEDLHWADPSSLGMINALLPLTRQCALLLLLVYRPPIGNSKIAKFHQQIRAGFQKEAISIELASLSRTESGQLLDNLLGVDALHNDIRNTIILKSDGNPFYLEEVIRSLINSGAIMQADDRQGWVATPELDDIKLPDTLQGIIMARIDQLDPETKRILQIASIIGRNFPYQILAKIMGESTTVEHK